jgi:hypothetical protein
MYRPMAIMAGLGMLLASIGGASAEVARPAPELLVLGSQPAAKAPKSPTILRGSAVARKPAPATAPEVIGSDWQVIAGKNVWLVDRTTGDIRSCINQQTTQVGLREVLCTPGDVGRYRRTFGPNFQP